MLFVEFTSSEIIIPYGIHPFDICHDNPELWNIIKITYIFTFIFSNLIISNFIYSGIILRIIHLINSHKKNSATKEKTFFQPKNSQNLLKLLIGLDTNLNLKIYIPESGLYQNFLITGTIGSGKTSSAMYPFTRQLMQFNSENPNSKIGMLILDVKGNYFNQVKKFFFPLP